MSIERICETVYDVEGYDWEVSYNVKHDYDKRGNKIHVLSRINWVEGDNELGYTVYDEGEFPDWIWDMVEEHIEEKYR